MSLDPEVDGLGMPTILKERLAKPRPRRECSDSILTSALDVAAEAQVSDWSFLANLGFGNRGEAGSYVEG